MNKQKCTDTHTAPKKDKKKKKVTFYMPTTPYYSDFFFKLPYLVIMGLQESLQLQSGYVFIKLPETENTTSFKKHI